MAFTQNVQHAMISIPQLPVHLPLDRFGYKVGPVTQEIAFIHEIIALRRKRLKGGISGSGVKSLHLKAV